MRSSSARVHMVWLVCSITVVFALDIPAVHLVVIAAAIAMAASGERRSAFVMMLSIGISTLLFRTALFALTGHTGSNVIFTLPALTVFGGGGLQIGGEVTAEVISASLSEGLRIVALMSVFGAAIAHIRNEQLIRSIPRFLFEGALVLSIALTFFPQLARSMRRIKEAQSVRGIRSSGMRNLIALVIPLLSTAMDRSIGLAESLDCRGFGRHGSQAAEESIWRKSGLLSAVALMASGALWINGIAPGITRTSALVSLALLLVSLFRLSRLVTTTRYRSPTMPLYEKLMAAGLIVVASSSLLFRWLGLAPDGFESWGVLSFQSFDTASILIAASLGLPALIASVGQPA